ncbi:hypothetical protein BST22_20145 [Mycolicibacterium chubuense]|uniref:PASTA domain-containing protein n=1 Tax=Mycolicibacterium chubuense TaxID=1800 RepID=A0A0J6WMQ6_MYCCU|nr:hypothetical protein [Mycolicibacterium chubuense]KMO83353.1 hypothetical protein MCHUDSM44219_01191 [Mycolicibacterium chubuense]ORA47672.1 hypothetical protein BST22_20145 [Mycolicibacterium chubuense]SPY00393.1 Uncharacterised protein [Mycolicibacterium chubuense]
MRRQVMAASLMTVVIVAGAAGVASPAAADTTDAASTWDMPDVKGAVLQTAVNDVKSAADPRELQFVFDDTKGNRDVMNLTNWTVCWQYPKAEATVSPKVKKISFGVKRLNDSNCYKQG